MTQEKTSICDYKLGELLSLIENNEMPECVHKEIFDALPNMKKREMNTPYHFVLVNIEKRRYFSAHRVTDAVRGAGCSMSYWRISYGMLQYRITKNPFGTADFEWIFGKRFGRRDDVVIPIQVHTKKEVLDIAKKLSDVFNF